MIDLEKQPTQEEWELLTATSSVLLKSRWKILWEYVICGRTPMFTLEAFVRPNAKHQNGLILGGNIGALRLYVNYKKLEKRR